MTAADLDAILIEIGEFGKYQIITYFLICIPVFFSSANSLTYVFTAGVPEYRCFVDGCDDPLKPVYDQDWLEFAIPSASGANYEASQCTFYSRNSSEGCEMDDFLHTQTESCDRWVFSPGETTIVNQWEITCLENQWQLALVGTNHFAGTLIGSPLMGYLADRFGRKKMLLISVLTMAVTGIGQAVSPDYIVFQVFVFLNAIASVGVYICAFVLGVEMVGPSKREMTAILINYFFALGAASVGVVAWFAGEWEIIQLAIAAPPLLFVLYYWFLPESIRWLLSQNRNEEVHKILKTASKMNGTEISEPLLASLSVKIVDETSENFIESVKNLIKSRILVIRTLELFYVWAAVAFVFYGISLNSTSLGGNKYVNYTSLALVEIPGYTLAWVLLKRGRRVALCGTLLFCAATCLPASFVPQETDWAVLVLFLFAKVGITASFGVIYVYTAELYPTSMRSASTGACLMMDGFGAMLAPFVPLLGEYFTPLPMLSFGVVALTAGLLCLLLPETKGTRLPETIQDAQEIGKQIQLKQTS